MYLQQSDSVAEAVASFQRNHAQRSGLLAFAVVKQTLLVGLGGLIGSIARYRLSGFVLHRSEQWRFPLSTFCVNVLGCFVLGALLGFAEKHAFLTANTRLFLFTGLLGGFTTFSAFGAEGINLMRRGEWATACLYATLSVLCGFAAVWLGIKVSGFSRG